MTSSTSFQSESEHLPLARNEAAGLLPLLKHASPADVRLLIQVSAAEEKALQVFAAANPLPGRVLFEHIEPVLFAHLHRCIDIDQIASKCCVDRLSRQAKTVTSLKYRKVKVQ